MGSLSIKFPEKIHRPNREPDFSIPPNSFLNNEWNFWLCDHEGSPFVYCSYGRYYTNIIALSDQPNHLDVGLLNPEGYIGKASTVESNRSDIHREAMRLITEEIMRRELLGN